MKLVRTASTWTTALLATAGLTLGLSGLTGCHSLDGFRLGQRSSTPKPKPETTTPGKVTPLPKPSIPSDQPVAGTDSMNRARILADQGQVDAAIKEFEKAIEENPLLTGAHMGLGEAQLKSGNLEKAEKAFSKAATLEPKNFKAQFMHASVLQEMGKLNESIRAYLRAINLRPEDFQANLNLGTAYLQAGEPQSALAYSKHAVEIKPDDGPARANLGVVYQSLGRHEEAVVEFQQAAELTELSPELLTNLADSYGRTKRYEEMVATLEQVVEMKPTAVAFERLGSGRFRLGLYDKALDAFRKASELDPNHYPALNGIGVCRLQQWMSGGQSELALKEEGLTALRQSLRIEKNQPKVMELLGRYK
ncbi:MAG: tetratricopeptide repeat protein [Phycisphaerales bacterium]